MVVIRNDGMIFYIYFFLSFGDSSCSYGIIVFFFSHCLCVSYILGLKTTLFFGLNPSLDIQAYMSVGRLCAYQWAYLASRIAYSIWTSRDRGVARIGIWNRCLPLSSSFYYFSLLVGLNLLWVGLVEYMREPQHTMLFLVTSR